jgi:copper oxidase (laccase) domain-containing protein
MDIVYTEPLNRGRFETWTRRPDMYLLHVTQVHGVDIATPVTLPCEADGILVSWGEFDKPLAIKTADCLPIVVEGEAGAVVLHAGWRGLAHGILAKPELELVKPQRVFIGPSIHECCFEVSEDFHLNFPGSPWFRPRGDRFYFNLQEEAKRQLRTAYPSLLVGIAPVCTCCSPRLHSFRRNKTAERNWNLYIKG